MEARSTPCTSCFFLWGLTQLIEQTLWIILKHTCFDLLQTCENVKHACFDLLQTCENMKHACFCVFREIEGEMLVLVIFLVNFLAVFLKKTNGL